ncbi:beta-1,3-galactosyl-O-glycosyl-glycoprotein beta-1,6-N-acetylglucosaminyltransferase-like isoform X1 [Mytilus californianus]|uniref:beta-1,3-galactosyl-O-glycosyl-glycoprotein beta-1,6-N-acetylglucosaminyltransferase-like isoform X1 n=1 Tax=Mytilus californianus TaxID=6549 RepID=UPI002247D840|nr:beta-1,3-galactosyl-O-glycosyl-glycoprotein beta-1,6-N-acetylglucosaminyltransferase-like isoform X1 [Mytilus californianus]
MDKYFPCRSTNLIAACLILILITVYIFDSVFMDTDMFCEWSSSYTNDGMKRWFINENILTKKQLVGSINCRALLTGQKREITRANSLQNEYLIALSPFYYISRTRDCKKFLRDRGYITSTLSSEEEDFPIAYSVLIFKAINQFERLLRSIYRPQNFYCVHADTKMSDVRRKALETIVNCFDNVFMSSISYDVRWGKITVLQADLVCMKDLLRHTKWKYFINLTGQDFPLKTNLEIVKILKAYYGANDVSISNHQATFAHRWTNIKSSPPVVFPYKGSLHITVNRPFVEYAITNKTAIQLLKWLVGTIIPDESFFSTLNFNSNLGIPGSFQGNLSNAMALYKSMTRYKIWKLDKSCNGQYVRGICIPAVEDLFKIHSRPELFINKVYWDYEHYVLDCLEESIWNRTIDNIHGMIDLNISDYSNLYFVKHALKDNNI